MTLLLKELSALVGGKLIGDESVACSGANPWGEAGQGEVTMLDDDRSVDRADVGEAAAVVTPVINEYLSVAQIVVSNPHEAFAKIVARFRPPVSDWQPDPGIDDTATIAPTAQVHATAIIGPGVTIGHGTRVHANVVIMPHCEIGDGCNLYPGVTLYEYTRLDDRVTIHAGSVVGAHGFGYRRRNGRHEPTAQLGYVHIESDVDLGACVTIDRGTYGATRIGQGTKIDNQVMVAHNCKIGRNNLICSQVGIAGSCTTGDDVILAGQVGLKDHIKLGDRTIVGAQAGVMEDCQGDEIYLGSPATRQRDQMQIMAVERRLPEMRREIKHLRRDVDELRDADQTHRRAA